MNQQLIDSSSIWRKALIVISPGKPEDGDYHYLKGTYADYQNLYSFLTSPLGGAWYPSEIEVLESPSSIELLSKIENLAPYEYTLIVFSGHGFVDSSGITILILNNGEQMPAYELEKYANKRTLILDCCRNYAVGKERLIKSMLPAGGPQLDPLACRNIYNSQLLSCKNGIIVANACSKGQESGEDDNGGLFLSALIAASHIWQNDSGYALEEPYIMDIRQVHNIAADLVLAESKGAQTADLVISVSGRQYFPFAVIA